jgi:light-regulated signal transduction histidine kinase (bacteriophytochrome)
VDMDALARSAVTEVLHTYVGPTPAFEIGELPSCQGDPTVLRQVWCNLIGNALKYSAKQTQPRIDIRGHTQGRENVYEVQDNGAGFDMQYASKLFKVFQRLHSANEFIGTGVGLAIVQRIIERHGGRIWAEGQPDRGARFQFTLPAAAVSGSAEPVTAASCGSAPR